VLIAGQCPFCKEELKKKISKIKKEDCERHKLRYQAIRADPTLNAKLKRYWEDHWKKRKNDKDLREKLCKYAKKYYLKNKEQVIRRNKDNYHIKSQDPEWMRARAEKTRLYRLNKVDKNNKLK
jgi:hypothetical protein